VPHALEIMKAAYRKLGMDDLATDVERIYALNYPQGAPIEFKDESIMQRAWDALGMDR